MVLGANFYVCKSFREKISQGVSLGKVPTSLMDIYRKSSICKDEKSRKSLILVKDLRLRAGTVSSSNQSIDLHCKTTDMFLDVSNDVYAPSLCPQGHLCPITS